MHRIPTTQNRGHVAEMFLTCKLLFQLPFDEDDFSYLNTVEQHNLINEWSDSSDSGVSGKLSSILYPFFHCYF